MSAESMVIPIELLHGALCRAFPSWIELKMMVSFKLERNLNEIAPSTGNLRVQVFELIEWAQSQGSLHRLITGAHEFNPTHPELKDLITKFRAHHPGAHLGPSMISSATERVFPEVWDCDLDIVLDCVDRLNEQGGLYGFTVKSNARAFQDNFCQRLVAASGGRGKMRIIPRSFTIKQADTIDAVQQRAREIAAYKANLEKSHLVCAVKLESDEPVKLVEQTNELWTTLRDEFQDNYEHWFVMVVFTNKDFPSPNGVTTLGAPRLNKGHIIEWINRCASVLNWEEPPFSFWKTTIIKNCVTSDGVDVQAVFEYLDWSRKELNVKEPPSSAMFLEELKLISWVT